jgi:hypothetical protein
VVVIVNLPRVREGALKLTGETPATVQAGHRTRQRARRLAQPGVG